MSNNNKKVKDIKVEVKNDDVNTNGKIEAEVQTNVKDSKIKSNKDKIFMIIFIVCALIILGIYLYQWKSVKDKSEINNSYLLTTNTTTLEIKDLENAKQILSEAPHEYFVLISYTGDAETYNLEKELKIIIDKYKLNDSFYYYNASEDRDCINKLNDTFKTKKIKKIPTILYIKNNEVVNVITRNDNNMINSGDFQKLLDIYDFKSQ